MLQQLDYLDYIDIFHDKIKIFHVKDAEFNPTGRSGAYGGFQPWLKLGSYHDAVPGQSTSAVHDRIRRGTSPDAVRMSDFPVDLDAPVSYCANTRP